MGFLYTKATKIIAKKSGKAFFTLAKTEQAVDQWNRVIGNKKLTNENLLILRRDQRLAVAELQLGHTARCSHA